MTDNAASPAVTAAKALVSEGEATAFPSGASAHTLLAYALACAIQDRRDARSYWEGRAEANPGFSTVVASCTASMIEFSRMLRELEEGTLTIVRQTV